MFIPAKKIFLIPFSFLFLLLVAYVPEVNAVRVVAAVGLPCLRRQVIIGAHADILVLTGQLRPCKIEIMNNIYNPK